MRILSFQICQVEDHTQEQEVHNISSRHEYKIHDWGARVVRGKYPSAAVVVLLSYKLIYVLTVTCTSSEQWPSPGPCTGPCDEGNRHGLGTYDHSGDRHARLPRGSSYALSDGASA